MKTLLIGFLMLAGIIISSLEGSAKIYFQFLCIAVYGGTS